MLLLVFKPRLMRVQVSDTNIVDLMETVLNSPYINNLSRQFVLTAVTKLSARPATSMAQKERIVELLAGYATSPALEIQQRAVEYISLYNQVEVRAGVLEQMPAPELKVTVMGTGRHSLQTTPSSS